jgi:nicotinamide riboside transporter PnuC
VAASGRKASNPFYVVLMVVGVAFVLTACAYGWSSWLKLDPQHFDRNADFVELMDRYGVIVMIVELVLLTVLTFLAIGTDDFWERRAQGGARHSDDEPSQAQ